MSTAVAVPVDSAEFCNDRPNRRLSRRRSKRRRVAQVDKADLGAAGGGESAEVNAQSDKEEKKQEPKQYPRIKAYVKSITCQMRDCENLASGRFPHRMFEGEGGTVHPCVTCEDCTTAFHVHRAENCKCMVCGDTVLRGKALAVSRMHWCETELDSAFQAEAKEHAVKLLSSGRADEAFALWTGPHVVEPDSDIPEVRAWLNCFAFTVLTRMERSMPSKDLFSFSKRDYFEEVKRVYFSVVEEDNQSVGPEVSSLNGTLFCSDMRVTCKVNMVLFLVPCKALGRCDAADFVSAMRPLQRFSRARMQQARLLLQFPTAEHPESSRPIVVE